MTDYYLYCSECKYRVLEDDDDKIHKDKFGCENLIEKELKYSRFESEYWLEEIFELLDVAEDLNSLNSPESEIRDPFGSSYSREEFLFNRKPRIAFILIDNAVEKLLYSKIFMTSLGDKLDNSTFKRAKNSFPLKLSIILSEKLITKDDESLLLVFHQIRNKLYHNLIPENILFIKLTDTYLVYCRDILKKVLDILYPLKSKKEELILFNETEIISLFLSILEDHLEDLKKYLNEIEITVFPYIQEINKNKYKDLQEYIIELIKNHFILRDNPKYNPVFDKEISSINIDYDYVEDLLDSVIIIKKMPETEIDVIKSKISEIIKRIVNINDINQILYYDIGGYYEYMEMEEDRLREMRKFA